MVASYDSGQAKKERIRRAQLKESRKIDGEKYPALAKYADPISYPTRDIVGREAERDEILSAMMRPELSSVILLAPAGTGKALADSTMIAVNDARGYVPMKALRVGDQVFGRDGLPTPVVGVFPQGRQRLFTVVTDCGEVRCNDEHIWTVFDKLRGVEITKTLAELMSMGMEIDGRPRFAVPAAEGVRRGLYDNQVRDWPAKVMFGAKRLPEWITVQTLGYRLSLVNHVAEKYRLVPCGRDHVQVEVEDTEARKRLLTLLASTGEQVRLNGSRIKWRIVKADYVDIVKVRNNNQKTSMTCIKVAAEDGLFQATENHIVTHNTALTQSVMVADPERVYLEVDPTRLAVGEDAETQMGRRLKEMFEQAEQYAREEDTELVMFMDEFHQIVQLSSSAVESIKPVLADAGTRGIRVIAATTFEEYNKYIKANQPLAQRLQPIRLNQPDKKTTVKILRGFAERHGVAGQFPNDDILTQIVEYTDRYMESATQPRKSIIILDAMIGKHRFTGRPLDMKLLMDTIATTTGMNLAFQVDGTKLKEQMDAKVYSQDLATSVLNRRLQLCVADLNNKSKPMLSVLFVGSTGVGKTELTKQLANLMFGDDRERLIRFDMTEFSTENTLDVFRKELAQKVGNVGHAVLLFDEVEKANKVIVRLLLQILDDGRLSDEYGRQVSFLNTYIVMTTNAGADVFKDIAQFSSSDTGDGQALEDYMKLINRNLTEAGDFPPELLGRIDAIVPFQPLSRETKRRVVYNKLGELRENVMAKHATELIIDPNVLQYLVDDLDSDKAEEGGARGSTRVMEAEIATEIATFINENPNIKQISVSMVGDLLSDNKFLRKTRAHPVVRPTIS